MRRKHPSGLTAIERAILARLKKGPAALSGLAHAARCKSSSIKVHISRLRKKLPCGMVIPKSFYGFQSYSLQNRMTDDLSTKPGCCKTETGIESVKPEKKARAGKQGNTKRNNMLCVSGSLPDYTLCELTLRLIRHFRKLARATMFRSWYSPASISRLLYVPSPALFNTGNGRGN